MGVDHGGTGGHVPPEFGVGDDGANCPPQILSYKYKNERSVAFKSSRRSPSPPTRLKKGHPTPYPTPLGTNPPSALAMRPPRNPARSTPMRTSVD